MSRYHLDLVSFHVYNTRAVDDDTDYATLSIQVNDQPVFNRTIFIGDKVDNGRHGFVDKDTRIGLSAIVEVGPNDTLKFNYVILNKGHANGDRDKVEEALGKVAGEALAKFLPGGDLWSYVGKGIGELIKIIDADCDGIVVADQFSFTGTDLQGLTAHGAYKVKDKRYPGTDSHWGCGSNSDYTVTWYIHQVV